MANLQDSKSAQTAIKWAAIGLFGYYGVVKPILDALGDTEEKKFNEKNGRTESWDPNFWVTAIQQGKETDLASYAGGNNVKQYFREQADIILESWSYINDDEPAIYSVFRRMKSQVAVSCLAWSYENHWYYKTNLFVDLQAKLSAEELYIITRIVSKLPVYK